MSVAAQVCCDGRSRACKRKLLATHRKSCADVNNACARNNACAMKDTYQSLAPHVHRRLVTSPPCIASQPAQRQRSDCRRRLFASSGSGPSCPAVVFTTTLYTASDRQLKTYQNSGLACSASRVVTCGARLREKKPRHKSKNTETWPSAPTPRRATSTIRNM